MSSEFFLSVLNTLVCPYSVPHKALKMVRKWVRFQATEEQLIAKVSPVQIEVKPGQRITGSLCAAKAHPGGPSPARNLSYHPGTEP
jgi:hypothetical protein